MPERSLKGWFELAFHLFVSEQWEKVREVVDDNDATYRWLKEQILREIRIIEEKAFPSFLGSAALNIRDRLITLKHVSPDEETFNKVKFWLKQQAGKFTLEDSDNSTEDRVVGCKIALLDASFLYFDEPQEVTNYFRSLLAKLRGVGGVESAIQAKDNPTILAQVKIINDAAKECVLSLGQELGDWPHFDIPSEALPTGMADYEPPTIWCFGDYGMADGQLSYPEKVAHRQRRTVPCPGRAHNWDGWSGDYPENSAVQSQRKILKMRAEKRTRKSQWHGGFLPHHRWQYSCRRWGRRW